MKNLYTLMQKITAQKLRKEIQGTIAMKKNKNLQTAFNDEMVAKTWIYQKKYGFEINPKKGNDFWDVEADAFKHAFGSAILYFRYGALGSTAGGIYHENQTTDNPDDEWNMDSWNNYQGREIAKEIIKEYGKDFYDNNPEECEKIVAGRVVYEMRNNKLINHPSDNRKYQGLLEYIFKLWNNLIKYLNTEGITTGQAAPIDVINTDKIRNTKQEKTLSQKINDLFKNTIQIFTLKKKPKKPDIMAEEGREEMVYQALDYLFPQFKEQHRKERKELKRLRKLNKKRGAAVTGNCSDVDSFPASDNSFQSHPFPPIEPTPTSVDEEFEALLKQTAQEHANYSRFRSLVDKIPAKIGFWADDTSLENFITSLSPDNRRDMPTFYENTPVQSPNFSDNLPQNTYDRAYLNDTNPNYIAQEVENTLAALLDQYILYKGY